MLTAERDPFIIPVVGTSVGVLDDQMVPIMVDGHHASSWGQRVATLMGQGTVLAFVAIKQAAASTPIALIGVMSVGLGGV
jgi:hypothetical protein